MHSLWEMRRGDDEQKASIVNRSILGWVVLLSLSLFLLFMNTFLLIVYPTVGTFHSIFGVVFGSILVVGTTANLMGIFYDNG